MKFYGGAKATFDILPADVRALLMLLSDDHVLAASRYSGEEGYIDVFMDSSQSYLYSQSICTESYKEKFSAWVRNGMHPENEGPQI